MFSKLLVLFLTITACGRQEYVEERRVPPPADGPFAEVAAIVSANCTKCHNGRVHPLVLDSEANFKGPKVKARIANGSMPPPPAALADGDKSALLSYLQ